MVGMVGAGAKTTTTKTNLSTENRHARKILFACFLKHLHVFVIFPRLKPAENKRFLDLIMTF